MICKFSIVSRRYFKNSISDYKVFDTAIEVKVYVIKEFY